MKKSFIILTLLLTSCKGEAISTEKKANYQLEFLFEKDGCKMYRFYDGRYIYWTDCSGKTQYQYSTPSGKSHTTHRIEQITN